MKRKNKKKSNNDDVENLMNDLTVLNTEIKKEDTKNKPHDVTKLNLKNRIYDKYFSNKTYLIQMNLNNGFYTQFLIKVNANKGTFKYQGLSYIIDESMKVFDLSSKLYKLEYHQGLALPIKRSINITEIKEAVKTVSPEVDTSINPKVLEDFINAKVAEGVMKGGSVEEFLKSMKLMIIINMVATLTLLLLFIQASGILNNIKLPF